MPQEALKARPSASPDASVIAPVSYRKSLEREKATRRFERQLQREPSRYVPACDDVACNVCRKGVNEKAPWNR